MHYRAGLPGWRWVARAGLTIQVRVEVLRDSEADVFVARSPDLDGLIVEAKTLDELRTEVMNAAAELLDLAMKGQHARARTDIHVSDSLLCAA